MRLVVSAGFRQLVRTPVIQHVGWGPMLYGASLVPCFVVDQSSERAVAAATKFFPDVGASLVSAVAAAANANRSTLRRQNVSAVAAQTRVLPVLIAFEAEMCATELGEVHVLLKP